MALEKLAQLTTFITQQNWVDENQIASWMENGRLVPVTKKISEESCLIGRFEYDAVVSIERFCGDEDFLLASICTWLNDNDSERFNSEVDDPQIEADILDDKRADVEIRIPFSERLEIVSDDTGKLQFNGKRWRVAQSESDIAESAAVGDSASDELDKPYKYGDTP